MPVRVTIATAGQPGAVALLQLHGTGAVDVLRRLTGAEDWPAGRLRLREFAGIDEGLAVALRDDWAQLMPHGGPRVVRELLDRLRGLGASFDPEPDPRSTYPEAGSAIEADMLAAIAAAASPAAVDALTAQPARWRAALDGREPPPGSEARRLDALLAPPTVVVVGRPNVGKSTLTNAMLGRAVSLVADLPGTTRDWVAGLAELVPPAGPRQAVAVRWVDTPGIRATSDSIEREAIALARRVLASADVLIAMRDPDLDWPDLDALPREPDLYVLNKMDASGASGGGGSPESPLRISAAHDRGLEMLSAAIIRSLGLSDLDPPPLWAFSETLRAYARGETVDLAGYVAPGAHGNGYGA